MNGETNFNLRVEAESISDFLSDNGAEFFDAAGKPVSPAKPWQEGPSPDTVIAFYKNHEGKRHTITIAESQEDRVSDMDQAQPDEEGQHTDSRGPDYPACPPQGETLPHSRTHIRVSTSDDDFSRSAEHG